MTQPYSIHDDYILEMMSLVTGLIDGISTQSWDKLINVAGLICKLESLCQVVCHSMLLWVYER